MEKYQIANLLSFQKKLEIVIQILGGAIVFCITIFGVFKLVNINYSINLSSEVILFCILAALIIISIYILLRVNLRLAMNQWNVVVNSLESQITASLLADENFKKEAIPDITPRGGVIDYRLVRSILSKLKTEPFLKLILDPHEENINIRKIMKGSLSLYINTPGMNKTYLVIKETDMNRNLLGEPFFVNCDSSSSYKRDYALTLFRLIFPILGSATDSLSQIHSGNYGIEPNRNDASDYYYYIDSFKLKKMKNGQFCLLIPII